MDSLCAAMALVTQSQAFLGCVIEFTEQLTFPAVPCPRPDCANINSGQDRQIAQTVQRFHFGNEVFDGFGIGQVALLRG